MVVVVLVGGGGQGGRGGGLPNGDPGCQPSLLGTVLDNDKRALVRREHALEALQHPLALLDVAENCGVQ